MTKLYYTIFTLLFMAISLSVSAQMSDDEIFGAMDDELQRNMKELKYKEYNRPFHINYELSKVSNARFFAKLGGVINETKGNLNTSGVAVKVGNYRSNDEKYLEKVNGNVRHNDGAFRLPKELSYDGIRRSFWIATNNVYKQASEIYANKQELIKENNIDLDAIGMVDLSEEEPSQYRSADLPEEKSYEELKNYSTKLSSIFESYPELMDSKVLFEYQNKTTFLVNSEGTQQKLSFRIYNLQIKAEQMSPDNRIVSRSMGYFGRSFDELPGIDQAEEDIKALVNDLRASFKGQEVSGKLNGPLLLEQDAVAEYLVPQLFKKGEGLISNPKFLVNDQKNGFHFPTWPSWATMIDKKVVDRELTVKMTPHMETYEGETLLGTVSYDAQGVLAPDEMVLIDKGVLQQQLVSRMPTTAQKKSSGHMVPYIKGLGGYNAVFPSVVHLIPQTELTENDLITKAKEIATEEDMDYYFVIRPIKCSADRKPLNIYRVSMADGTEELLRNVSYKTNLSSLKSLEGMTADRELNNLLLPVHGVYGVKRYSTAPYWVQDLMFGQEGAEGAPVSIIAPKCVLLKTETLEGVVNKTKGRGRFVKSPTAGLQTDGR